MRDLIGIIRSNEVAVREYQEAGTGFESRGGHVYTVITIDRESGAVEGVCTKLSRLVAEKIADNYREPGSKAEAKVIETWFPV